jgi:tetratricopeptide (TPR) repeat protein
MADAHPGGRAMRLVWLLIALLLVSCAPDWGAENRAANDLFRQGRFDEAFARYEAVAARHPSTIITYNAGTALAGLRRDNAALDRLDAALEGASPAVQAAAHYNRGIVLFRLGDCAGAHGAFSTALLLQPGDADARFNLDVVERELARGPDPQGACRQGDQDGRGQSASQPDAGGEEATGDSAGQTEAQDQRGVPSEQMRQLLAQLQQSSSTRATDLGSEHPDMSVEDALHLLEEVRKSQGGFESLVYGSSGIIRP